MEYHCECYICKNNLPFNIPKEIINSSIKGNLVLFTGSGVSTESKYVYPYTLYEDICDELNLDCNKLNLSFSKLMSKYCNSQTDGRKKLLEKIKYRIDYVKSFHALYTTATRFHKELSSIYLIKNIFTTNWDDLFELECDCVPIVTSADFAFWDLPDRKIFKIHGSINNVGSIIATEKDYNICYKNLKSNLLGSSLKMALATKTLVFIGYSFEDEDFQRLIKLLKKELNNLFPHIYVVTLDKDIQLKIKNYNITTIITDGTFFIHSLKKELIKRYYLLDDKKFDRIPILLEYTSFIHTEIMEEFDVHKNPYYLYSYFYQDGLIDSFDRILRKKKTGEYSDVENLYGVIKNYEKIKKEKLKIKKYTDISYIDGYIMGLYSLMMDNKHLKKFPFYYLYNNKDFMHSLSTFRKASKKTHLYNKSALKYAQKYIGTFSSKDTKFQHTPFLL